MCYFSPTNMLGLKIFIAPYGKFQLLSLVARTELYVIIDPQLCSLFLSWDLKLEFVTGPLQTAPNPPSISLSLSLKVVQTTTLHTYPVTQCGMWKDLRVDVTSQVSNI